MFFMPKKLPQSLHPRTQITRKAPGTAVPKGSLYIGEVNGDRLYLSPRDRSYQVIPMGALFNRLLDYCCYLKAVGLLKSEVIVANFSDGSWILPFNPLLRHEGELSVQVNRRVAATVRVWGVSNSDATPRLEKWLKVL